MTDSCLETTPNGNQINYSDLVQRKKHIVCDSLSRFYPDCLSRNGEVLGSYLQGFVIEPAL